MNAADGTGVPSRRTTMCSAGMADSPTSTRRATYDDILALPDNVNGEIIDGELFVSPRPAPRHAVTGSVLTAKILSAYHIGRGGPGGWWILFAPEFHFGDDVLIPEVAGWRRHRMPGTARLDRQKKLAVYAREQVAHAWLIDPIARTHEVLRLENERWVLVGVHASDDEVRAEPFAATTLPLAHLWVD
jgi:putative restriction endonuclease